MSRPPNPEIRAQLREKAIDYVLANGIADLSLRPLAKVLKTNARMLVYHFGSREGLMREILGGLREREDARVQAWFRGKSTQRTMAEFLRWYWRRVSAPKARPAARLVFELYALALRDPESYPGVLTSPVAYWQGLLARAGVHGASGPEATLLLASFRGLLLDLCATGDEIRVRKGMEMLANLLEREGL